MKANFVTCEVLEHTNVVQFVCSFLITRAPVESRTKPGNFLGDYYSLGWLIFVIQMFAPTIAAENTENSDESVWHTN